MPLACVELPPDELRDRLEVYRMRARNRVPLFDDGQASEESIEHQERFTCWGCGQLTPLRKHHGEIQRQSATTAPLSPPETPQ